MPGIHPIKVRITLIQNLLERPYRIATATGGNIIANIISISFIIKKFKLIKKF